MYKTSRVVLSINTWDPKNINLEWFDLALSILQRKRLPKEWDVALGWTPTSSTFDLCNTLKGFFSPFPGPKHFAFGTSVSQVSLNQQATSGWFEKFHIYIPSIPVKYHKIFRPCLVLFLVFFSRGKILAAGSPNASQFGRRLWFSPEVKDMCLEQTNQSAAGTWRLQILGILPV